VYINTNICSRLNDFSRQGNSAMILFPAMMVGGHLLIAVVDKVPDLNFEPICREGAAEIRGAKDDRQVCMNDESAARAELARKWSEFASADRARCIRLSTNDRSASYVEVLTCLEIDLAAKKLRQTTRAATDAPEPAPTHAREKRSAPVSSVRLSPPPASAAPPSPPLPLQPQPLSAPGMLQIFCLPGLKTVLPACMPSGGSR
jgi:hypothetical protein